MAAEALGLLASAVVVSISQKGSKARVGGIHADGCYLQR